MNALVKIDGSLIAEASKVLESFGITGLVSSILQIPRDQVDKWRSDNLIRWFRKYEQLKSEGNAPPPALLIPALRAIAEEDDDDMATLWARLIAGFSQGADDQRSRKVFVALLASMTSNDAGVLIYALNRHAVERAVSETDTRLVAEQEEISIEQVANELQITLNDASVAAGNLARLGCFRMSSRERFLTFNRPDQGMIGGMIFTEYEEYYPTTLGKSLVGALNIPSLGASQTPPTPS